MKKAAIIILVVGAFCGGAVIGVRLLSFQERTFGKRYSKDHEEDVRELRRLIYLALPATRAIDAYISSEGRCPHVLSDAKGMSPQYLSDVFGGGATFPHWEYLVESNSYRLRMKLSWDGDLWYDKARDVWDYDPGDGSPSWNVVP